MARNFELPAVAVACSMADAVLPALVADQLPGVDVLFLETGYHFPETYATRDEVAANLRVNVVDVLPENTVEQQDRLLGKDLFARDPAQCCALRKVAPLRRTLAGYELWFTGVRRDEAPTRTNTPLVTWDETNGLVKVNPVAAWSFDQLVSTPTTTSFPSTRCFHRATRPLAASPAPARWRPATTPAPDAGQEPPRQNADYTYEQPKLRGRRPRCASPPPPRQMPPPPLRGGMLQRCAAPTGPMPLPGRHLPLRRSR